MPRLDAPGGWADRKFRELQSAYPRTDAKWTFLGCCTSLGGPLINHITEDPEEIDYAEFSRHVDLDGFKEVMGYSEDTLTLEKDWHVGYYRSRLPHDHPEFPSRTVLYLDHSRIEYVWVEERR